MSINASDVRRGMGGRIASPGNAASLASTVGLAFGPSTFIIFSFGVFIGPLSAAFGWSRPAIAFGSTIIALMAMVVAPLQGYLIDRYGARPVVLTSIPFFAGGMFLMSQLSGDITMFYVMCGLLPLLGLGLWSSSYLRVVSTWYDKHLGLAIGIANGGIGIGAALVPIIATSLMAEGGWQRAYIGLGLVALLVTWPLNYFLLRENPTPAKPVVAAGGVTTDLTFREIARTPSFKLMLVGFLALGFVNVGLIVNQVPLLIDGGVSPQRAAAAQATLGISILVGRFLCGVLLDRMPAPMLMMLVSLSGAVACLLYVGGVSDWALLISPILIGAVIGAEFDVLSYIIKKYFGIRSFGRAYGVVFAVFQFGAAVGATLLPLSLRHMGGYGPGLIAYAVSLLIAALCFLLLRPSTFERRAPDALPARA